MAWRTGSVTEGKSYSRKAFCCVAQGGLTRARRKRTRVEAGRPFLVCSRLPSLGVPVSQTSSQEPGTRTGKYLFLPAAKGPIEASNDDGCQFGKRGNGLVIRKEQC